MLTQSNYFKHTFLYSAGSCLHPSTLLASLNTHHFEKLYKSFLIAIASILFIAIQAQAQNCTVNAGPTQNICVTKTTLVGGVNGSSGPGLPLWTFISGPATPTIVSPNSLTTSVTGLTEDGAYVFELSKDCQDGSASQRVTINAWPKPVFTAGTDFGPVCSSTTPALTGTLPTGWTGVWSARLIQYPSPAASNIVFDNPTSPSSTVHLKDATCIKEDPNYYLIWTISNTNTACTYADTVVAKFDPDLGNFKGFPATRSICGPSTGYEDGNSSCERFYSKNATGTTISVTTTSWPASGGPTVLLDAYENGRLYLKGLNEIGNYTINIQASNSCGVSPVSTTTWTVNPAPPAAPSNFAPQDYPNISAFENFCLKDNPSTTQVISYSVGNATDELDHVGLIRPSGAATVSFTEGGVGTTSRTLTITTSEWTAGTYEITPFYKGAGGAPGSCTSSAPYFIHIYKDSHPFPFADQAFCRANDGLGTTATIVFPPDPFAYAQNNDFNNKKGSFNYRIWQISGPNTATIPNANPRTSDASGKLTNLIAGTYQFAVGIDSLQTFNLDALNCGTSPHRYTFYVHVDQAPQAVAGTDQDITCAKMVALQGNDPMSNIGMWSVVSSPQDVTINNPNQPAASISSPTEFTEGTYTLRWTVSSPHMGCPPAYDDQVFMANKCKTLPVSLLGFNAKVQGNGAVLTEWSTSFEQNNQLFEIERSKDLKTFEKIGEVQDVKGNATNVNNYQFLDNKPYHGTSYYRLKQVDVNGTSETFRAVPVVVNAQYMIYPNPVIGSTFNLELDEPTTAMLHLYNVSGREIGVRTSEGDGSGIKVTPVEKLSSGIYVLKVTERGSIRQHRFVVK